MDHLLSILLTRPSTNKGSVSQGISQPCMGQGIAQPFMGQGIAQPCMGQGIAQHFMGQGIAQPCMGQGIAQHFMGQGIAQHFMCPGIAQPFRCQGNTVGSQPNTNEKPKVEENSNQVKVTLAKNSSATPATLTDTKPCSDSGTVVFTDEVPTILEYGTQFTRNNLPGMIFTLGKLNSQAIDNVKISIKKTGYLPRNDTVGVIMYTGRIPQDFYLESGTQVMIPAGAPFFIGEEEETFTKDTLVTLT